MLDPKLIRETPELVRAAIARKHLDVDLDGVLAIDATWRAQLQEVEALRAKQKGANTAMAALWRYTLAWNVGVTRWAPERCQASISLRIRPGRPDARPITRRIHG